MDNIQTFFPSFSTEQYSSFKKLLPLYADWNSKINVISRKDINNLYERHVLHSLAIAKSNPFPDGSAIMDVGTGGGFPGIPLAIAFPECDFTLIDSIGKKITVVNEVATALGLRNIVAKKINVNEIKETFDFIVSRAVCAFPEFVKMTEKKVKRKKGNGIVYLKGGDLIEELKSFKNRIIVNEISQWFPLEYFETKKIVFLPIS
jgi:16S rRNA (guanine527-N7)-methyltransferase